MVIMAKRKGKKGRRNRGDGSVYTRRSDGRGVATLIIGFTEAGTPKHKIFYGATEAEAIKKRDDYRAKLTLGHIQVENPKVTVAQYLAEWLEQTAALNVRSTTLKRYRQLVKFRINPHLGGYQLGKVTKEAIKGWLAWLPQQDRNPRQEKDPKHKSRRRNPPKEGQPGQKISIRGQEMALRVLNKALEDAVEEGRIGNNPIRKVKGRPRPPKPETRAMTEAQAAAFLKAAVIDRYYPLYVLALDSGMREGELFALTWDDLDFNHGTVTVLRALEELDGKVRVSELKTDGSRRRIELGQQTVDVLRAHREAQRGAAGSDLVFPAPEGGYLRRPNLAQRFFHRVLARAKLPRFKFHELRHTSATLLLKSGENLKVVSERLGHAGIEITLKHYAHVLEGMQKQAAVKMGDILGRVLPRDEPSHQTVRDDGNGAERKP